MNPNESYYIKKEGHKQCIQRNIKYNSKKKQTHLLYLELLQIQLKYSVLLNIMYNTLNNFTTNNDEGLQINFPYPLGTNLYWVPNLGKLTQTRNTIQYDIS